MTNLNGSVGNQTIFPLMIFIAMAIVRTLAANGGVTLETIAVPDDTKAVQLIPDRVDSQSNIAYK
jgi:hypothetical protein